MIIFGGFVDGLRTNEIYRFHFLTKRWELIISQSLPKQCPPPRAAHSSIVFGDKMIIFGGKDEDNEKLNDVWAFDFKEGTWERYEENNPREEPGLPFARSGHSA